MGLCVLDDESDDEGDINSFELVYFIMELSFKVQPPITIFMNFECAHLHEL